MRTNIKITRIIGLFLVSLILLLLISSCTPPRVLEQENDFNYEIDDEIKPQTTKPPSKSKSDEVKYQRLVTYIVENGESYLYKYANRDGVSAQTYIISDIMYEKVVWREYTEKVSEFSYITYKIGLSYSEQLGIHILSECSYTNTGYSYALRIMPGSSGNGTVEIVETKVGNDRSALINFDAANFNGEIKINRILTFGNVNTSDDFDVTAKYIVNGVLANTNKFIETEITGATLKIIGIGKS